MTGQKLLKKDPKILQESVNVPSKLMKRWERAPYARQPSLRGEGFPSLYELHILLRFTLEDSVEEWIACFEKETASHVLADKKVICGNGEEQAVLIDVIQLVQFPERQVPAFVRLMPVDLFYRIWPEPTLYLSISEAEVMYFTIANRKRKFFAGQNVGTIDGSKMPNEMVERRSQIVDAVSGNDEKIRVGDYSQRTDKWKALSSLRIVINADNMEMGTLKGTGGILKVREVFFGPFNFYADQSESVVGCH